MPFENVKIIVGQAAYKRLQDEHSAALFDRAVLERNGTRTISLTEPQLRDLFNHHCLPKPFADAYSDANKTLYRRDPERLLEPDEEFLKKIRCWREAQNRYEAIAPLVSASRVSGYADAEVIVLGMGN